MTTNTNSDFERRIKQSLEGYEVPFQQGDWQEMESKLNSLPANSSKFKWSYSMNIFIAVIACAGLILIIYNTTGSSENVVTKAKQITPTVLPVVQTSDKKIQTPANNLSVSAEHVSTNSLQTQNENSDKQAVTNELVNQNENEKNSRQQKRLNSHPLSPDDKDVSSMESKNFTLPTDEPRPYQPAVFGDMIDPGQGTIFSTKEKIGEIPLATQTSVNVGWNEYVIYDPKKSKDSAKSKPTVPAENNAAENHSSKKGKSDKKQNSTPVSTGAVEKTVTTPVSDIKTKDENSAPTDSSKHSRKPNKHPKFKGDKSILDPY